MEPRLLGIGQRVVELLQGRPQEIERVQHRLDAVLHRIEPPYGGRRRFDRASGFENAGGFAGGHLKILQRAALLARDPNALRNP